MPTYALGIILYELLTGQRPCSVPAEVAVDELRQIIAESLPLRLVPHAAYQGELEAIVEQALRKAPAERFSVQALGTALTNMLRANAIEPASSSMPQATNRCRESWQRGARTRWREPALHIVG